MICLVVKESLYDAVVEMFWGSGNSITITVDAKQDWGGGDLGHLPLLPL